MNNLRIHSRQEGLCFLIASCHFKSNSDKIFSNELLSMKFMRKICQLPAVDKQIDSPYTLAISLKEVL